MHSLPPLPSVSRSETTNPSIGTSKDSSSSSALRSSLSSKPDALEQGHMLNPLIVIDSLLSTLKKNEIPGPTLLRFQSEFSQGLGTGTESRVLGVNPDFLTRCRYDREERIRSVVHEFPKIAIKRARPQVHAEALQDIDEKTCQAARNHKLAAHLRAVKRKTDTLCEPALRNHRNIVKLLYWGLCLDTLESLGDEALRIPLLVLERAGADLETFLGIHKDVLYDILRQIRLDFWEGLDALHAEGISHVDLKSVKFLIFRQDVRHKHQQRYVAKLCDIGSNRSDIEGDKKVTSYAGTRDWRALEALEDSKLLSGALKRCDVYAYGLVVRSVFARNGTRSLCEADKRGHTISFTASREIMRL